MSVEHLSRAFNQLHEHGVQHSGNEVQIETAALKDFADAEILADVYLLMTGGQSSLLDDHGDAANTEQQAIVRLAADRPPLKVIHCNDDELAAHQQRLAKISKISGLNLWE